MKQLGTRLFVAMALLAVISVAGVSLLNRKTAHVGFLKIDEIEKQELRRTIVMLSDRLRDNWEMYRSRDSMAEELRRLVDVFPEFRAAALVRDDGTLIVAVDLPNEDTEFEVFPDGILARWLRPEGRWRRLYMKSSHRIELEGIGRAALVPIPTRVPDRASLSRQDAVGGVDRGLLAAGLGVILLSLISSAVLARRIVGPLEALTVAARGLGLGDLSRRVEARGDDELAVLGRAFNEMASSLERSEALRRRIVSDVMHELRTPLAVLQGQVEAAQDGLVPVDASYLATLHEDILHLGSLVSDLQDLALAEAGQLHLEPHDLDTGRELRQLCRSMRLDETSQPRLSLELEDELTVWADALRFRQIFQNLLENAQTHAPDGHIVVASRAVPDGVEVTVSDDGSGIAAEDLPNIFDRFYRADASRQRKTGGHGLGLGIVQQLVHLHRGRVSVESTIGQGSRFQVVLPSVPSPRESEPT